MGKKVLLGLILLLAVLMVMAGVACADSFNTSTGAMVISNSYTSPTTLQNVVEAQLPAGYFTTDIISLTITPKVCAL